MLEGETRARPGFRRTWLKHARALQDASGAVSDGRRFRTGLRQVRMDRWLFDVNGERLFLKGSNQGPTGYEPAALTAELWARAEGASCCGSPHGSQAHPIRLPKIDNT